MSELQIRVDPRSFQLTGAGSITGIIHFKVGQYRFPDEGWDDFVVVILSWWLGALIEIVEGRSREQDLLFMEGPVFANVRQKEDTDVTIRFLRRERDRESTLNVSVSSLTELIDELLKAARCAVEECRKRKWSSPEVDTLHQQISKLQASRMRLL